MKNKLIFRMYLILIVSTVLVAAGVYGIVTSINYNSVMDDARSRANAVKDFIVETLNAEDFSDISNEGISGVEARRSVQVKLDRLQDVGNLRYLYITMMDADGEIYTTLNVYDVYGMVVPYVPPAVLAEDLRVCFQTNEVATGSRILYTDSGSTYSIYWPVLSAEGQTIAAVVLEFDMDAIYQNFRTTAVFSLIISAAMILIFSIISYVSLGKASDPIYKKLAYTDFLTGVNNRLAFEQRLVSCEPLIKAGKRVTLIMFDINNLKIVNDTMGHKFGDQYIIGTVKIINEIVGDMGDLYRIGGDEFAAIVIDQELETIDKTLDMLRGERRPILGKIPFSCATGAATYTPGVDKNLKALANRADEVMYGEKHRQKQRDRGGRRGD